MNTETRVGLFIIIGVGIFLYLSIHIGDIKLNRNEYSVYSVCFEETGGIESKSPVKMAGVSVGWVDSIHLLPGGKAEIKMRVKSVHKLGKNAFARVAQEGFIGTKAIEIDPGDSSSGYLAPGSMLPMPGRAPTTVNELLEHFKGISNNVGDLTSSLRTMIATSEAEARIKSTLTNIHDTSKNIASVSEHANDLVLTQKDQIKASIDNVRQATEALREKLPGIASTTHSAVQNADDAMAQAKEVLKGADEVVEKINNGDGLISKLLNEGQLYTDVQKTVQGVRSYVQKTQNVRIKIDGHLEKMIDESDRKGYAGASIYTYADYFYKIELMSGRVGKFERQTIDTVYYDSAGKEIVLPTYAQLPDYPGTSPLTLAAYASKVKQTKYSPSKPAYSLQFGKTFTNLTIRGGLIEDTFGLGLDYQIPFNSDRFTWLTTIEAFDFNGHNRPNGDNRMHVKWLNRVSFMKTLYATFGVDDLVGQATFSPFIGLGICFDDDDLKYILPSFMSFK